MRVTSFSYKFGPVPMRHGRRLVIDARVIDNPYQHGEADEVMRANVLAEPLAQLLVDQGVEYLEAHPDCMVAVGCSYGRHRSVAVADEIARRVGVTASHTSRGANGRRLA